MLIDIVNAVLAVHALGRRGDAYMAFGGHFVDVAGVAGVILALSARSAVV